MVRTPAARPAQPTAIINVLIALLIVVAVVAALEMIAERRVSVEDYAESLFWALTSLMGNGDPGFASGPIGGILYVVLIGTGLIMIGLVTGAIIAVIIDFLLKEGQGLGASGFRDHIVICGWNPTAREAVDELRSDTYKRKLVLIHDAERNPAEKLVYYVRGDPSNGDDLARADINVAEAALVFPTDSSNEADMKSILTVMAIESIAPDVRTVVEVNNPRHVEHFQRAHADEIIVTPRLASHLVARAALYPGLSNLITDMVSGGAGSELYRVKVPEDFHGVNIDEASQALPRRAPRDDPGGQPDGQDDRQPGPGFRAHVDRRGARRRRAAGDAPARPPLHGSHRRVPRCGFDSACARGRDDIDRDRARRRSDHTGLDAPHQPAMC